MLSKVLHRHHLPCEPDMKRIAIIGDYDNRRPSHVATNDALKHAATYLSEKITTQWLPTKLLEKNEFLYRLHAFDCVWGAPGDPESSVGYINAIRFARQNATPYLGT